MISVAFRKHLAAWALLLLLPACDTALGNQGGPVEIPPADLDDPQTEGVERALMVGTYLPPPKTPLQLGQLSQLTLEPEGTFLLGLCEMLYCEQQTLQAGTFTLEQSIATGAWALALTPTGSPAQRYLYERLDGALVLQRVGDSHRFELTRINDEPPVNEQSAATP